MKRVLPLVIVAIVAGCGKDSPAEPTPPNKSISVAGNLNFGAVDVGATVERQITIASTGTAPLVVASLTGPVGRPVFQASWSSGTIQPGATQAVTIAFTPDAHRSYNGTFAVNADHASGGNTLPITASGVAPLFEISGSGNTVFDMPSHVDRVRIRGEFRGNSSNFIIRVAGRLVVNELVGDFWEQPVYEGVHLVTGGGVVEITNSSGVAWSFTEQR